ncbi:hypothetical protein [Nostoc sp.]|uniref:hypothetical protein n=1 Tax=Nostoc sp. TaxID=1180 RepID=UPI002FFA643A
MMLIQNKNLATFNRLFMAKADNQKVIELNMTDEESDAAIPSLRDATRTVSFSSRRCANANAKFGCDCPKAINALRQTIGITIGVEGEYLPSADKITPCTDKKIQNDSQSTNTQ